MKSIYAFFALALFSPTLFASTKALSCANSQSEITLSGVATTKAVYMSPGDFAWVPPNGFVSYPVLVTDTPICYSDEDGLAKDVYVVQLTASPLLPDMKALQSGVRMAVKGKLFEPMTAHHFEKLIFNVSSLTVN